jgi:hypothetical protein
MATLLDVPDNIRLQIIAELVALERTSFTELPRRLERWSESLFVATGTEWLSDPGWTGRGMLEEAECQFHRRCRLDTNIVGVNQRFYRQGNVVLYTDNKFVAVRGVGYDTFKDWGAWGVTFPCWAMPLGDFLNHRHLRPAVTIFYRDPAGPPRSHMQATVDNSNVLLFPLADLPRASRALENLAWNSFGLTATVAPFTPRIAYVLRPGPTQTGIHHELLSRLGLFVTNVDVVDDTRHTLPVGGQSRLYFNSGHGGVTVLAALNIRMTAAQDELQALRNAESFDPIEMAYTLFRFYVENAPFGLFIHGAKEDNPHNGTQADDQLHHRLAELDQQHLDLVMQTQYLLATFAIDESRIHHPSCMRSSLDWHHFLTSMFPYLESSVNPDAQFETQAVGPLLQPPPQYFPRSLQWEVKDFVYRTLRRYQVLWGVSVVQRQRGHRRLAGVAFHDWQNLRDSIRKELGSDAGPA